MIVLNGLDRDDKGEAATPPKGAPTIFLKEASAVTFPIFAPALEAIRVAYKLCKREGDVRVRQDFMNSHQEYFPQINKHLEY